MVLLLFRSSPRNDLPPEQGPMAAALVGTMMTNGVLVNYDCGQNTAWVNRAVWDKYNVEQKRNMTLGLATVCETEHAAITSASWTSMPSARSRRSTASSSDKEGLTP